VGTSAAVALRKEWAEAIRLQQGAGFRPQAPRFTEEESLHLHAAFGARAKLDDGCAHAGLDKMGDQLK
jgi:hypothetical protein